MTSELLFPWPMKVSYEIWRSVVSEEKTAEECGEPIINKVKSGYVKLKGPEFLVCNNSS